MGDIIETIVTAFQPLFYYHVSGNGMWFDVKTLGQALVYLSKQTSTRCQYWIELRNPGILKMMGQSSSPVTKTGLPFTLSGDKYTRFWIRWDATSVFLGIGDDLQPVIVYPITSEVNYIIFDNSDLANPCSYKFQVPPLRVTSAEDLNEPKITGKLEWKPCDNQLPDEAVIGGYIDGEVVYIVRAHHRQSLTPGMFVPSKGLAFIPWGGSDNPTSEFEALCGYNFKWKPARDKDIPKDSFIAGYSEIHHEPLYIGRVLHNGHKIPGKVQMSHKACYIAFRGSEVPIKKFEVLTVPGLNAYCANEFLTKPPINLRYFEDHVEDAFYQEEDEEDDEDEDE